MEKSEEMVKEADSLFAKDNDDWSRSYCFGLLGLIRMKQANYEDALANIKTYMDILLPKVGNEHYDIAQGHEWYAEIYTAMGDPERAAENYQKAIEIYKKRGAEARRQKAQEKLELIIEKM